MHRPIAAIALTVVIVLAGCGGFGGGPADTPTTTQESTPGPTIGDGPGDGSDAGAGDDDVDTSDTFEVLAFDRPGTFVFDVYLQDEGEGEVVWDVQQVQGEQLTVRVVYDVGETTYESTVTGTRDDIQSQLLATPAGSFMLLSIFSPSLAYYEDEQLTVGDGWSITTNEGSMSVAVVSRDTVAGVECYRSEMRVNDQLVYEHCLSTDLGLAPYVAFYDEQTGEQVVRMELVEYTPR